MGREGRESISRYLITGGAGFIGSHLADLLVSDGHEVLVLDDLSTGRRENLASAMAGGKVEFILGSTADAEVVDGCMESADVCVHLASAVGVHLVIEDPLDTLLANVRGTDVVLASAARHGRRLLFASSSEVYGKNSRGALGEHSDRLLGPPSVSRWAYANAKAFGEFLANAYVAQEGADMVIFRLFNTTGPRQLAAFGMVLPRFVRQALAGEDLTVFGDGTQTRCFLHVADAVDAIKRLSGEPAARGGTFNIGSTNEMTIADLAALVVERAGSAGGTELTDFNEAYGAGFEELGRRRPDVSAIGSLVGWEPMRSLTEIIDDMLEHERELVATDATRVTSSSY